MFLLFVAWMAIIIMNLLIGLTISSLEKLNEKAEKMRVKSRLDELRGNKDMKKCFVCRREGIIKTLKNNKGPSYKVIYTGSHREINSVQLVRGSFVSK